MVKNVVIHRTSHQKWVFTLCAEIYVDERLILLFFSTFVLEIRKKIPKMLLSACLICNVYFNKNIDKSKLQMYRAEKQS